MGIRIIGPEAYRRERWKNGLGWTHQIACGRIGEPGDELAQAAESWDWRLSIALIDRDCEFSIFPGIDRALVLIEGTGMRLTFADGESTALAATDPQIEFPGERALACTLADGPTRDFNAMWRRDRVRGRVERCALDGVRPLTASAGAVCAVHLLAGAAGLSTPSAPIPLPAGGTAILAGSADTILDGSGSILVVRFAPIRLL